MILVILESPYAAETSELIQRNVEYARACLKDCLLRGEAPLASHLLYTQEGVLNDTIPEERKLGIEAGLAWGKYAVKTVVYTDYEISKGMMQGIARAKDENREIEFRQLYSKGN